jgi:hypothetical protein
VSRGLGLLERDLYGVCVYIGVAVAPRGCAEVGEAAVWWTVDRFGSPRTVWGERDPEDEARRLWEPGG